MTEIEGSAATRTGDDGGLNEDAYLVDDGLGLYVVGDGLSRAPAGEVASNIAVKALESFVTQAEHRLGVGQHRIASRRFAARAIQCAMNAVLRAARSDKELTGMATTLTMLLTHGQDGVVGHVGDSRAYLIRDDRCHLLTSDHEWTEAVAPEEREVAVGAPVDTFSIDLRPGDTYLLCTDGAENVVEDPAILAIADGLSPRMLAARIVSAAHRADPQQDATVVAVRVRAEREPSWLWLSTIPDETTFGHAVGAAVG